MIDLQGYSDEPLQSIRYDVINVSNQLMAAQGFVNDQQFDMALEDFTTNYFSCYDIELALGTNSVVLRCEDLAGNIATNLYSFVLRLDDDKTPPVIALDRPVNGHRLLGNSFTARGRLDDPTATVTATVQAGQTTITGGGLVERNGYFWIEEIPLSPG